MRVIGGTDAVTLHFYFVSPSRLGALTMGERDEKIKVKDNILMIESEPVARVAIPLTTAAQLLASLSQAIVQGIPELQATLQRMGSSMVALQEQVQAASAPEGGSGG